MSKTPIARESMLDAAKYVEASAAALEGKQHVLAYSLLKCARYLGEEVPDSRLESLRLTHDQLLGRGVLFQRNARIADLIREHFGAPPLRVLDVGGHFGLFSQLIPDDVYFLCDPLMNQMYAEDLLARGDQFDVVIATHVFEHIPDERKPEFFATLVSLATKGVILSNPVDTGGAVERQQFLVDVYGSLDWLVEHLECGTPTLDIFDRLAAAHDLKLHKYPNGNHFVSMLMFAMQNFAEAANDPAIWVRHGKIVRYINNRYQELDSEEHFRDYSFVFRKSQ